MVIELFRNKVFQGAFKRRRTPSNFGSPPRETFSTPRRVRQWAGKVIGQITGWSRSKRCNRNRCVALSEDPNVLKSDFFGFRNYIHMPIRRGDFENRSAYPTGRMPLRGFGVYWRKSFYRRVRGWRNLGKSHSRHFFVQVVALQFVAQPCKRKPRNKLLDKNLVS